MPSSFYKNLECVLFLWLLALRNISSPKWGQFWTFPWKFFNLAVEKTLACYTSLDGKFQAEYNHLISKPFIPSGKVWLCFNP